jgi:hypothetical protein
LNVGWYAERVSLMFMISAIITCTTAGLMCAGGTVGTDAFCLISVRGRGMIKEATRKDCELPIIKDIPSLCTEGIFMVHYYGCLA